MHIHVVNILYYDVSFTGGSTSSSNSVGFIFSVGLSTELEVYCLITTALQSMD